MPLAICSKKRAVQRAVLIVTLLAALAACEPKRPEVYEIPDGYHGWIEIRARRPGCPPLRQTSDQNDIRCSTQRDLVHELVSCVWMGPRRVLLRKDLAPLTGIIRGAKAAIEIPTAASEVRSKAFRYYDRPSSC